MPPTVCIVDLTPVRLWEVFFIFFSVYNGLSQSKQVLLLQCYRNDITKFIGNTLQSHFSSFQVLLTSRSGSFDAPPPLQSATVFWDVSTNWPGSSHRVTARFSKKNLYNLPRCFAKITDFKKCKKKVYKVPPKMGTLYENVAGTL